MTDPLQQILWENVAYLPSDRRRQEAFALLRQNVGLEAARILAAPPSALHEIGRKGILPASSSEKLRSIAEIALEDFGGDLRPILKLPFPQARKALKKFPSIGDPGAEKILLFARSHPVLALDSNGLRVLRRLGYGKEDRNYTRTYRLTQEAAAPELPRDFDRLIEAHQLLRRHGQELCKTNHPRCEACPLRPDCAYGRKFRAARPAAANRA